MRFLVELESTFPSSFDAETRARVIAEERRRGRELHDDGTIERIFRIPGTMANVGIWNAADGDALHQVLTSLPTYPHFEVHRIQPLATHPLEGGQDPPLGG